MNINDKKDVRSFLEFVYEFYKSMKEHEITLVYEGEITHQITKAFTSLTESNMAKEEESNTVQKKVFHVMVECLQNMTKHSDDYDIEDRIGNGLFIVGKKDGIWNVITANKILKERIEDLKKSIDTINALNKDELNALYKKQIREGSLSEKGGAGLGLIDIARKTGKKLDYQFLPLEDNKNFFFLLKVRISSKPEGDE